MPDPTPFSPVAAQPRRPRAWVWILVAAGLGILLLVGAAVTTHLVVSRQYDLSASILVNESALADQSRERLVDAQAEAAVEVDSATTVLGAAADGLVAAEARDALQAALDAATATAEEAESAAATPLPDAPAEKPFWTWEIATASDEYRQAGEDAEAAAADFAGAREQLVDAQSDLDDAAVALFASVGPVSQGLLAENVSARTGAVIALRDAAADVTGATDLSSLTVGQFTIYATSAAQLRASQKAELAEKKGPLLDERLAVEAFARSLAGGVLLDFDWKPIVIGFGQGDSMGGTATWNSADGGFSTITLSNSVARLWPSARAKALVAHEVGHSISAKCYEKFDWESADANEEWATAWAISQGFTSDANGVQAYGEPRRSMIEKAKTCR
jgi:hypothetical protein